MNRRADLQACLRKLLAQAERDHFTGIAFVGYVEGKGWMSDACGVARDRPIDAREQLPALDAKLSRLAKKAQAP